MASLNRILTNFRLGHWEPSELNGGKLCEAVYTIVRGHADGKYAERAMKPRNMVAACHEMERATTASRSVRIQTPRMLMALYEVRNNRGVGHLGGDVDPSQMDASVVVAMAKWLVAEVVRLLHDVDTTTAAAVVEMITEREVPIVWKVGDRVRVLRPDLTVKDQMLILLYHAGKPAPEDSLRADLERPHTGTFRRDVLLPAHRARLVNWDDESGTVSISPTGVKYVEERLPLIA